MPNDAHPRKPGVVTRLETGIDWFSATLPAGHNKSAETWAVAADFQARLSNDGNTAKATSLLGYRGVVCGKCFLGEREDGILLRSTGGISGQFFEALYMSDMHVSRLDLQCTVWVDGMNYHLGREARQEAAYHRTSNPKEAKRKISVWDNEDGGYTLYIGSKASAHFCRLYDKGAESGETYYENSWRYEVELHNDAATDTAAYLLANGIQLETVVASTVRQYYTARGVAVPWYTAEELNAIRPLLVIESDDGRSLKWLAAQVRPTVARLLKRGYTASVFEALGLEVPQDVPGGEGQ